MAELLGKSLQLAAGNDQAAAKNATDAMKINLEHVQKMAALAIDAAKTLVPSAGGVSAGISGLGGLLNQSGKSNGAGPASTSPAAAAPAP